MSAVRVLVDVDEAEQALTSGSNALRGRLRVAAPLSFGVLHLGPAVDAFLAAHPGVELDLDFNDRLVNLVEEGFDLALRIGRLTDSSLVARRLAPIRFVTCASPAYLKQQGEPQTPEELAAHQGLVYSNIPEGQIWQFRDHTGKVISVRVPARLHANNGDVLLSAAIRGLGIVISPTFLAYRAIESGELRPILTPFEPPAAAAYTVFPSHRHVPARVRAFVDALAERFGYEPYWDACLKGAE